MHNRHTMSKVNPILPKENNYVKKENCVVLQMKLLIKLAAILGLNRMYLLKPSKLIQVLWNGFSIIVLGIICIELFFGYQEMANFLTFVMKNLTIFEYIFIYVLIIKSDKRTLLHVFEMLNTFDKKLNILDDLTTTSSSEFVSIWLLISALCNLSEHLMVFIIDSQKDPKLPFYQAINHAHVVIGFTNLTHDLELVFFFTLFYFIHKRILIVKAHVEKRFQRDRTEYVMKEKTATERLSEKVKLDTSELHEAYKLLYDCSTKLNGAMSSLVSCDH